MHTADDFRTVQVQAIIFTPGLQFRAPKVMAHLLTEYEQFDGDPQTFPQAQFGELLGAGLNGAFFPHLMLQSADGKLQLQAGASRLDVTLHGESIPEQGVAAHLTWASELALKYLAVNEAKAGRVSCIIHRLCDDPNPGKFLSVHFCKPSRIDGPLNRPVEFQLHAQKRFRLAELFEVNSWMRFKTAVRAEPGALPYPPNLILVEQDFNSLAEQMDSREMKAAEMRRFFEVAPREMRHVLDMYLAPE